jgi:transcription elongation GreA/GreB family factor
VNNPLGSDHPGSELSALAQQLLRDELAVLRAQRDQLRGDNAEDHRAADSGDRAEAIRRADDVFRIEDRISEINRLLTIGTPAAAARSGRSALAEGSVVTLRFTDGDEETWLASSVLDAPPAGTAVELMGLDSPLARAVAGHGAGDTITWTTPTGKQQADIVTISSPDPSGR